MSAGGLTKVIPAKQIEDFKQNNPGMITYLKSCVLKHSKYEIMCSIEYLSK